MADTTDFVLVAADVQTAAVESWLAAMPETDFRCLCARVRPPNEFPELTRMQR